MRIIAQYSPIQEVYSIDESFIDLEGLPFDLANPYAVSKETG